MGREHVETYTVRQFPSLVGRLKTTSTLNTEEWIKAFPSLVGRLKTHQDEAHEDSGHAFPSLVGRLKTCLKPEALPPPNSVSIPCR